MGTFGSDLKEVRIRPRLLVAVGIVGLGLPTVFSAFPELYSEVTDPPVALGWRLLAVGAWVVLAGVTVQQSIRHQENVETITGSAAESQRQRRTDAFLDIMNALTRGTYPGIPEGPDYEWCLYVYDEGPSELRPVWPDLRLPASDADPRSFQVNKGATGRAFVAGKPFAVFGDPVHNDDHELTEAQQDYYAGFRTVCAVPVYNHAGKRPIGVLTVVANEELREAFSERQPGESAVRTMAETVQSVLTDMIEPEDLL